MKKQTNSLSSYIENKLKEYPHYPDEKDIQKYIGEIKAKINYDDYNTIYERLNFFIEKIDDYISSYNKSKDELVINIQNILYILLLLICIYYS